MLYKCTGGLRGVARGGLAGLTLTSLYALYNNWEHMKGSLLQQSLWGFCHFRSGGHFSSRPHQFIGQSGITLTTVSLKNWRFQLAVVKIMDGWPGLAFLLARVEARTLWWLSNVVLLYPLNWKTTYSQNSGHDCCQYDITTFVYLMIWNCNIALYSQ